MSTRYSAELDTAIAAAKLHEQAVATFMSTLRTWDNMPPSFGSEDAKERMKILKEHNDKCRQSLVNLQSSVDKIGVDEPSLYEVETAPILDQLEKHDRELAALLLKITGKSSATGSTDPTLEITGMRFGASAAE